MKKQTTLLMKAVLIFLLLGFAGLTYAQNYVLEFDGNNEKVTCGTDASLKPTSAITVEAWVYVDSYSDWEGIVCNLQDNGSTESGYGLYFYNGNLLWWVSTSGETDVYSGPSYNISTNQWVHIAGTYNGSDLKLYVNGTLQDSRTKPTGGAIDYSPSPVDFTIGSYYDDDEDNFFDGKIEEVRVWNDVRTQTDIQNNMYSELNGSEANLVGYYNMNDGSVNSLTDHSSNSNTGTLHMYSNWFNVSPISGSTNAQNYVLEFDGNSEKATCGTDASLKPTSAITVEAWVYVDSFDNWEGIVCNLQDNGTEESGYGLYFYNGNLLWWVSTSGETDVYSGPSYNISTNQWVHIAGTYDGSDLKLYVNGTLQDSRTKPTGGAIDYSFTPLDFTIGSYYDDDEDNFFDGKIEDVRVWNDVRTQAEIQNNMNSELNGSEANLVGYYNMNDGSGTSLTDSSSNSNTGALHNICSNWQAISPLDNQGSTNAQNYVLEFNGNNEKVTCGTDASLKPTSAITVEAWIYADYVIKSEGIVCNLQDNGTSESGYGLFINNNNELLWWIGTSGETNMYSSPTFKGIFSNTWFHIAGTYNGSDLKLYVNGILQDSRTKPTGGDIDYSQSPLAFTIGSYYDDDEDISFHGKIAEVRVWNDVRTQNEIQNNVYSELDGSEANLVGYYNMKEGSGTSLTDSSSNSNAGTLQNMDNSNWHAGTPINDSIGPYSGGIGIADDPFQIATSEDLFTLSKNLTHVDAHFIQTADIAFKANETQVDWDQDGTANWDNEDQKGFLPLASPTYPFGGVYDGQNHTIDNLYIDRPAMDQDYIGLFSVISGSVKNMGLTNINVSGDYYTGAIAGKLTGNIDNCFSTGTVSGHSNIGGLVGASGDISKSYSTCTVSADDNVAGGLVGIHLNNKIYNSYSTGDVYAPNYIGGFIGEAHDEITNCYSMGEVHSTDLSPYDKVGGFCGYSVDAIIKYSYSTSSLYDKISGATNGFLGDYKYNHKGTYTANFFDKEFSNQDTAWYGAATGKTTSQMKSKTTYINMGYDFTNTWAIDDGSKSKALINDGYPYLMDDSGDPLPVTWLSFTGQRKAESRVELNWSTASEQNTDRFEIQRSDEGEDFTSIGKRKGAGNSNQMVKYQYMDTDAPEGTVYYRLKQVDYNGAYEYSDIVAVQSKDKMPEGSLSVYPNPVSDRFNLQLPEYEGKMQVEVYNMSGQQVYQKEISERQSLVIPSAEWPEGVYMTICRSQSTVFQKRIIKE